MAAELAPADAGQIVAPETHAPRGFVQLPKAVVFHPDLSDGAKLLFAALLSYAWQEGSCFPGQLRLADDLGISERTIRNRLRELVDAGFLRVKQRGQGKTNVYLLLCPGDEGGGGREPLPKPARKPASAKTGSQIPVRTDVEQEPALRLEPEPPPPPRSTPDEDPISGCLDDAGTAALVQLGMSRSEADEWGREHDQDTLQEAVALTRTRATANGAAYVRSVLRNWQHIESPGTRRRRERAAEREVGERYAAEDAADRELRRDLRERFDELSDPERRRLIDQARASNSFLVRRAHDHPVVIAAAVNLLQAEGGH